MRYVVASVALVNGDAFRDGTAPARDAATVAC
jgi:hypothetical protein